MDSFDALTILNNRVSAPATSEHNQEGCCACAGTTFGKEGSATDSTAKEDKAPIEAHPDLLPMSSSALVKEFKRLQEDRVQIYGLFER